MGSFRSLLLAGFLVATLGAGLAGPAAAADPPLKINISNYYAKPKIKVAKNLKVTVSCSRDCG